MYERGWKFQAFFFWENETFDGKVLYVQYVAKIVYSILAFYSTEIDMQAVINQVFFLLWEKAEQIDTKKCEDIKYYLAAIAKHEVINERNKIRPHVELDENVIGNSAKVFADIELREVIYAALQQLKTEYQIILLKYYYQEKLIREIASEEGIPESTVKTKLKRGREKLRKILIKEGVIDENELQ